MRIFLKIWVAIMIASFTAITGGLATFAILPKAPWSLIFLISFIIFAIICIWGLYVRDHQIDRLTSKDAELERKRKEVEIKERETNIERNESEKKQRENPTRL